MLNDIYAVIVGTETFTIFIKFKVLQFTTVAIKRYENIPIATVNETQLRAILLVDILKRACRLVSVSKDLFFDLFILKQVNACS